MKKSIAGFRGVKISDAHAINFEEKRALALMKNRSLNKELVRLFQYYVDLIPYKQRAKYEVIEKVTIDKYNKVIEWAMLKNEIIKRRALIKKYGN